MLGSQEIHRDEHPYRQLDKQTIRSVCKRVDLYGGIDQNVGYRMKKRFIDVISIVSWKKINQMSTAVGLRHGCKYFDE